MVTYLITVSLENFSSLTLLCECLGWEIYNLQNDNAKAIRVKNTEPMLRLFKNLSGSIYTIKNEKK